MRGLKNIILFVVWMLAAQTVGAQTAYDALLSTLYSHSVPTISVDSLALVSKTQKPILLDTRAKAEFETSHLPGALWVDYDTFGPGLVANLERSRPVVVYCSVGYRSEKIGEKLKTLGFNHVRNLYGGIFQWKNEGYEVVNQNGDPTDSVHCYNRLWSVWMTNGIKVYE